MKLFQDFILNENLAQAKSILMKKGLTADDETYKKIIQKTNKDGYTGLVTKLILVDGEDVQEVFDLYDDLKKHSYDLAKISKLSFDEIIELVYQEVDSEVRKSDVKKLFSKDGYTYFLVNYEGDLDIGSPAWCLKTKSDWVNEVEKDNYIQYVVVRNDKIKGNKIYLSVPNIYSSSEKYKSSDPTTRYGVTTTQSGEIKKIHDDNNVDKMKSTSDKIVSTIVKNIKFIYESEKKKIVYKQMMDKYDVIYFNGDGISPELSDVVFDLKKKNDFNIFIKCDYFIVKPKNNNSWGVVDINDKIIIPIIYEEIRTDYWIFLKLNNKWGIGEIYGLGPEEDGSYDPGYEPICDFIYDEIGKVLSGDPGGIWLDDRSCFNVRQGKKWSLIGVYNGREVVASTFDSEIKDEDIKKIKVSDTLSIVQIKNKFGIYCDDEYEIVWPVIYDKIEKLKDNFFIVTKNGNVGVIGRNNRKEWNTIIKPEYKSINTLSWRADYIKVVDKNNKVALFSSDRQISEFIYEDIQVLDDNSFKVKKDGKIGIYKVDDGDWVKMVDMKYDEIRTYNDYNLDHEEFEEMYLVESNKKWGLITPYREILPINYDRIEKFYQGDTKYDSLFIVLHSDDKMGLIQIDKDYKIKILLPIKYDNIKQFYQYSTKVPKFLRNKTKVRLKGKEGILDKMTGDIIIPIKYDYITDYLDGMIKVELKEKWGFIDLNDNILIPIKFDTLDDFMRKSAGVKTTRTKFKIGEKWGVLDNTGKILVPPTYDEIAWYNDRFKGKLNGKWSFLEEGTGSKTKHIKEWNEFFINHSQSL